MLSAKIEAKHNVNNVRVESSSSSVMVEEVIVAVLVCVFSPASSASVVTRDAVGEGQKTVGLKVLCAPQ